MTSELSLLTDVENDDRKHEILLVDDENDKLEKLRFMREHRFLAQNHSHMRFDFMHSQCEI